MPTWITDLIAKIGPITNFVETIVHIGEAVAAEVNAGNSNAVTQLGDNAAAVAQAQVANTPAEGAVAQ